jgi:uncharacterized membrane protein YoaK (UPF0700 family)
MTPKDTSVACTPAVETCVVLDRWLPASLSVVAGMVDVAGYMSLGHVFTAHITGNLVVIAADFVSHTPINPVQVIAVPVFVLAVAAVWMLASAWGKDRANLLTLLLTLHFALLAAVLLCAVSTHSFSSPDDFTSGLTAMIAISAMACQFALPRLALPETPSTAVMTGNLTNAMLALLDLFAAKPITAAVRSKLLDSIYLIAGFIIGCLVAAAALPLLGDWIWSLPALLAAATTITIATFRPSGYEHDGQRQSPL